MPKLCLKLLLEGLDYKLLEIRDPNISTVESKMVFGRISSVS